MRTLCDQCWGIHLWCGIPISNILNPHWRCGRSARASFVISAPPRAPLPWYLNSSWKTCSPTERRTMSAWCKLQITNGLEVNPALGLLEPRNLSSRGHKYQINILHSRTDTYLHSHFLSAIRFWNSVITGAPSAVTLPAFKSAPTGCREGRD